MLGNGAHTPPNNPPIERIIWLLFFADSNDAIYRTIHFNCWSWLVHITNNILHNIQEHHPLHSMGNQSFALSSQHLRSELPKIIQTTPQLSTRSNNPLKWPSRNNRNPLDSHRPKSPSKALTWRTWATDDCFQSVFVDAMPHWQSRRWAKTVDSETTSDSPRSVPPR